MARRGKAASRQARQRRRQSQRSATSRQPTQQAPTQSNAAQASTSTSPGGASAASTPTAVSRTSVPASQRGSRSNPRVIVAGSSRLSERAIEEYHYVRRDLRNIAILVAIMAVILVAAAIVFSALGIGKTA